MVGDSFIFILFNNFKKLLKLNIIFKIFLINK